MEGSEETDDDDELDEVSEKSDIDEELDRAAQGHSGTQDTTGTGTGEIDKIGNAAGHVVRDDKPFRGIEEVERRDAHRWELDPDSADDGFERGTD